MASPCSTQYSGGGDDATSTGSAVLRISHGRMAGLSGKTLEAVIDLKKQTEIKQVGGSFLSCRSWIWMPDRVEFEVSIDGVTFTRIAEINPAFPVQEMDPDNEGIR